MTSLAAQTLFKHIRNKDGNAVHKLLHTSLINLDERDRDGQTFLMVASHVGCNEVVTMLLDSPVVDINAVDNDNWTALLNAAKEGYVEVVCQLTDRNADLEHRDTGGWTALMWACYKNRTEVVIELLDRGANANVRGEHNMSCITWAAGRGYTEIVRLLLLHGAKPNTTDKYGTTPLMWAARKGHKQIVDYLLEEGATIDNAGMNSWTALIMASKGGYTDVISSLLRFSPNINAVDKDSYTALTHAAKEGHVDIVLQLLDKGAYVNRPDRYGDTILIHATKGGHDDVVKALLKKHVDVDVQGVDNKTALYWSVEKGHTTVVKLLLDANANTEVATKDGDTPLLKAVKCKNLEITQLLLEKGAKVSATDKKGDNVLHIAVRARSKRVTELLLRNPKDGRLLYRPNKSGETPYQLDAQHEKKILTQVFGARNLNADDSIEGYELYSSTIADVLSEPSLNTPITVGLYAKWGSGKSFLIKKLVNEMKNFTSHNIESFFEFSGLQFFISFLPSLLIGLIVSLAFRWEVGLGLGLGVLLMQYIFLGIMWIGSVKKDWSWAYYLSIGFSKKLNTLQLLLQVMFCNEPAHINHDTAAVKFLFTDNARLASVVGEKSITAMIGTLCDSLEQEYGTLVTRLYRVLRPSKGSEFGRFKSLCCLPYFLIVLFIGCCIIVVCCLIFVYGYRKIFDSDIETVDGIVIAFIVVIGLAVIGNIYTWWCMAYNLIVPPRKRVQKIMARADSLKMEGLMQNLKKEVELIGHLTHCMDAFRHTHTRLVIIVDGLDSCEQERLLQVLDTVHLLFSDDKSPFVTILAVDPHVIIKGIEHNLQGLFRDSSINGHDYLRNLVHLPFFLQTQTMPRTRYGVQKSEKSSDVITTKDHENVSNHLNATVSYHRQESIQSAISIPDLEKANNKKKHSPQRVGSGSNYFSSTSLVKHPSQPDLTRSIGKSSYFSDINPRSMNRMMNIIAVTGRLLRACNVEFNWYKLAAWVNITEQWPYRLSWIIKEVEDNENIQQNMPLKNVYESILPKLPSSKEVDPHLEIDRNEHKLQVFLQNNRPMLTVGDLKRFMPCTINVDPYLRKLIKEQLQNAENMSYEYGLYPSNTGSCDMFGWPYGVRRPTSRADSSPRATPTMRPVSAMRGLHGAATPCPIPPYGLYSPAHFLPYGQGMLPCGHNGAAAMNFPHNTRTSTQINLQGGLPSDSLTRMTVDDVCNLLSKLESLDKSRLSSYMACFQENNISGPVLLTCEITELKSVLKMTFGDWELFRTLIQVLREREIASDSARSQDPNMATDDGVDGKIKFTQEIRSDASLSIPQPSYPSLGNKKQATDVKLRDPFGLEQHKNRPTQLLKKYPGSKLNAVGEHSQPGYSAPDTIPEGKRMTRKDSFFGEVMLESAALRSFVEAVGVYTDTGEDSEEDTQKEESPDFETSSSRHHKKVLTSNSVKQPSLPLTKRTEEDPRYKLGDSESGDSDSEEVFLLARKTSSRRHSKTKSPSNLPKLKLNNMKSVAVSSESISGISKESALNNRMTTSKESVIKTAQSKSICVQNRPPKTVRESDKAPLLRNKEADVSGGERKSVDLNISTSDDQCGGGTAKPEDDGLPLTASPTPSCEHLALRLLSNSDSFTVPSAFKSVTPTSSRASSRASSLCLSHASSKVIFKEDIEDSLRMSAGTNPECNVIGDISVSGKSSYTCSPQSASDVQDTFNNGTDTDPSGNVVV